MRSPVTEFLSFLCPPLLSLFGTGSLLVKWALALTRVGVEVDVQ